MFLKLILVLNVLALYEATKRRQVNSNLISVGYPRFTIEPTAGRHYFSNSTGLMLNCQPDAPSNVFWILATDLSKISDSIKNHQIQNLRLNSITGLRNILSNGSMHFPPFTASLFNPIVHLNSYKCLVSNAAGIIVSRTVHVSAVLDQSFEAVVYDEFAFNGNTAVLKCQIPISIRHYIKVDAWIRDSNLEITSTTEKYSFFNSGELHVKKINSADSFSKFKCRIKNLLTNETKISTNSASIIISKPTHNIAPRILHSYKSIEVNEFNDSFVELPCAAEAWPLPSFKWYKLSEIDGQMLSAGSLNNVFNLNNKQLLGTYFSNQTNLNYNKQIEVSSSGSLILRNVKTTESLTYVCIAFNSLGEFTVETELKVFRRLSTSLRPKRLISDKKSKVSINCTVKGQPIDSIHWVHNGLPISILDEKIRIMLLGDQSVLVLEELSENSVGMYQCIAENELGDSAQDSIELLLEEIKPTLDEKFPDEIQTQIGEELSLKCVASGNPLPMITWYLDNEQIIEERNDELANRVPKPDVRNLFGQGRANFPNILWGDYVLFGKNQVVSHLNFTVQTVLNGGKYSCVAVNPHGKISHEGKIKVKGETRIKPMKNRSVVAQQLLTIINCDIVGDSAINLSWLKDGVQVPFNHRQRIHKNASLEIINIDKKTDSGNYTCLATIKTNSGQVKTISESMFLTVKVSPVIEDFKFDTKLQAGMRTRIYCNVAQGDLPLNINWLKDGFTIEKALPNKLASVRQIDQFSVALIIENLTAVHNGNYTCEVANDAALVSHTAELLVNIPPTWIIEPNSSYSATEGSSIMFDCVATGFPFAQVAWKQLKNKLRSVIGNQMPNFQHSNFNINKNYYIDNTIHNLVNSNTALGSVGVPIINQMAQQYHLIRSGPHYQVFENGSLRISEVNNVLDSGNYLCQANNGIGPGLSKMMTLKVNVPAKFDHQNKLINITALKGQSVSLKCEAFGDLPISITWLKQGEQIRPNEKFPDGRYQLEQISNSTANYFMGILNISSLIRSDSVRFECRVKNQFGGDNRYIDLIIKEEPEPPTNIQLESSSSRSLFIKWQTPFNGNSPIIHYSILLYANDKIDNQDFNLFYDSINSNKDSQISSLISVANLNSHDKKSFTNSFLGSSLLETHNHFSSLKTLDYQNKIINLTVAVNSNSYAIRGLRPATNYSIRMSAVNSIGKSQLSSPLYALTEEESPSEPPKNIEINVLNATSALITWSSPDLLSCNGLLKGFYIGYKPKNSTSHYVYKTLQVDITKVSETNLFDSNTVNTKNLFFPNQHQIVLNRLKPYTEYNLILQAYNNIGAGPRSDEFQFKTTQSTPSAAPFITKCTSPSSQTLLLQWSKLSAEKLNGELTGYKIHYYTFDDKNFKKNSQSLISENQNNVNKITQLSYFKNNQYLNSSFHNYFPVKKTEHVPADQNETIIENLNKFTNYTISIQASTSVGEGPLSEFVFCSTSEDLPEPPPSIKVVQTNSDSFYITWLSPEHANGILKSYTIYRRQIDTNSINILEENYSQNDITDQIRNKFNKNQSNSLYTFTVPKHVNYHRTNQLNNNLMYEFWVTASNNIGESKSSSHVTISLKKNGCSAEIINFDTIFNSYVGDNLELPCKAAGEPQPTIEWFFNGTALRALAQSKSNFDLHEHYSSNEQIFSSSLRLTNLQFFDNGNYSCIASNIHGQSKIYYQIHVQDLEFLDQFDFNEEDLDELNFDYNDSNKNSLSSYQSKIQKLSNSSFSIITSPIIHLVKSSYDYILIQWKIKNIILLNSILSYEVFYKPIFPLSSNLKSHISSLDLNSEWKNFKIKNILLEEQQNFSINKNNKNQLMSNKTRKNRKISINGLNCGTNYQLYIVLDTILGKSTASNILNVRTLGREPIAANAASFLTKLNSTTVKLNLDSWKDGGCNIFEYKIKWKQVPILFNKTNLNSNEINYLSNKENDFNQQTGYWNQINNIWHSQQPVFLTNLNQSSQYRVRVEMRNSAGITTIDYDFKVNSIGYLKPQSENSFRILSSTSSRSSSYSNQNLDITQDQTKNNDLIRSSTIGNEENVNQQITTQIILLSMFLALLFIIVIALFAFFHRTIQQKSFFSRSNRILQMSSDANSVANGPLSNNTGINATESINNAFLSINKQHLNKLHQFNMNYTNSCPNSLPTELSVLRNDSQATSQCLNPTYAKFLLKNHQINANPIEHTTALHNVDLDNIYQSLTLSHDQHFKNENLLSTFPKKPNQQNSQELYSIIQKKNSLQNVAQTFRQNYNKQSYELNETDLEQNQRYSIPKLPSSINLNNMSQIQNQVSEFHKNHHFQTRLNDESYITNEEVEMHSQFNLNENNLNENCNTSSINTNLSKIYEEKGLNMSLNQHQNRNTSLQNECNCCNLQTENECCSMNTTKFWNTNNCEFGY